MKFLVISVVLPTLALAGLWSANPAHQLPKRQSGCDTDETVCGEYCIPIGYTCCPDEQGGCPASEYCSKGDNGEYGCCEIGEICTGDGGVSSYYDSSTYGGYSYTSSDYYNTATTSDILLSTSPPTATLGGGSPVTVTAGGSSSGNRVTVTASGNSADTLKHNGAVAAFILGVAAML